MGKRSEWRFLKLSDVAPPASSKVRFASSDVVWHPPLFVWWLFQSGDLRRELGKRASGTGGSMKNISKPKVMSLKLPLPPFSLQQRFASRVAEFRTLERHLAEDSRCLTDLELPEK